MSPIKTTNPAAPANHFVRNQIEILYGIDEFGIKKVYLASEKAIKKFKTLVKSVGKFSREAGLLSP